MGGNAGDRIRGLDFSVLPIGLGVASGPNMEGRKSELDAIPLMPLRLQGQVLPRRQYCLAEGGSPEECCYQLGLRRGGGELVKGMQIPI